jgi:hypothetical protein
MSTIMPEPFKTVQDAIISKLETEGITCYDHFPIELYGVPSAYLQAQDVMPDYQRADQGEVKIGSINFALRYFVSLEGDIRVAHVQAYEGIRKVYRAFSGATLGGVVRDAMIERVSIDPVELGASRRPMLLVETIVNIRPSSYV